MSVYLRVLNVGFNIEFCGTYIVVYTLDTYCTRTRNVCNDRINQESPCFQRFVCALHRFIQKELVHIDGVCLWLRVHHNAFEKCLFLLSSIYRLGLPFEFSICINTKWFFPRAYNNVWAHWWRYTFILFYIHYIFTFMGDVHVSSFSTPSIHKNSLVFEIPPPSFNNIKSNK